MKKSYFVIFFFFIFSCSNDNNVSLEEENTDCANLDDNLICWTIIDDVTEEPIVGAYGLLSYGLGFGNTIAFDTTSNGLACFCWNINWDVEEGSIGADGYISIDLTGVIPSEVSIIRLVPN